MSKPLHVRLLATLKLIAEKGEVCPFNRELAKRLSSGPYSIQGAFQRLKEDRRIKVEVFGNRRIVTILPGGLRTADPRPVQMALVRPKVRQIGETAAQVFDTTLKDIFGRSRFAEHVRARQAVCLAASQRGWTLCEIGRVIGRDHTTIIHSRRVAQARLAQDENFAARFNQLIAQVPPAEMRKVAA